MDNIEVIDNLVDNHFCQHLMEKLISDGRWRLQYTANKEDLGFHFRAFHREEGIFEQGFVPLTEFVIQRFLEESKWNYRNVEVQRIFYNFQNRETGSIMHQDNPDPNHQTLLLYLNTNEGGTIIDSPSGQNLIKSEIGKGVSFDSRIPHRALGPTESKHRFVLNIFFTYTKKEPKT